MMEETIALPETLQAGFAKHVLHALKLFPNTQGQCAALCAYISQQLTSDGIENRVALGSLSCNSIKTFQYVKPIPAHPSSSLIWDGHAWLEFHDGYVGEPSLFRTAKAQSHSSNLRQHLERIGLIDKGALLVSVHAALNDYGLKYSTMSYLRESAFMPLIDGLIDVNRSSPRC